MFSSIVIIHITHKLVININVIIYDFVSELKVYYYYYL